MKEILHVKATKITEPATEVQKLTLPENLPFGFADPQFWYKITTENFVFLINSLLFCTRVWY